MMHLASLVAKKKNVAEGKMEYSYTVNFVPHPRGSYSFDGSGMFFILGQFSQSKKRKVTETRASIKEQMEVRR